MRLIVENMLGGIVRESTSHLEAQNRKIEQLIRENCSLNAAISMIAEELNEPFTDGVVRIRGVVNKVRQLKAFATASAAPDDSPRQTFKAAKPTEEDDANLPKDVG